MPRIYETVAVPCVTPDTVPVLLIVAVAVGVALHVPPVVTSLRTVVDAAHTLVVPEIAAGAGFTVTTAVTVQPVPSE